MVVYARLKNDETRDIFVGEYESDEYCSIFKDPDVIEDYIFLPEDIARLLLRPEPSIKIAKYKDRIYPVKYNFIEANPNERQEIYVLDGVSHWVSIEEIQEVQEINFKFMEV